MRMLFQIQLMKIKKTEKIEKESTFENLSADCEIQVNLTWFKFLTL